ncbi:hypothetical protein M5D96_014198 [Drosophila gunungcola]|uniref:Uncharacterized protein n=1 Tax=Drosophila gunungcola TaxID=103775 RepID=A0A9P9YAN3_9MUSC|nr:hypothetical protein M5D96_014198 [Drosophila gunungcola]
MELNYDGTRDREGFASYIHLNETLFESQRRDGYRFTDHFKDLRLAFTRAKSKTYKGKSMAKKMREDENGQE